MILRIAETRHLDHLNRLIWTICCAGQGLISIAMLRVALVCCPVVTGGNALFRSCSSGRTERGRELLLLETFTAHFLLMFGLTSRYRDSSMPDHQRRVNSRRKYFLRGGSSKKYTELCGTSGIEGVRLSPHGFRISSRGNVIKRGRDTYQLSRLVGRT